MLGRVPAQCHTFMVTRRIRRLSRSYWVEYPWTKIVGVFPTLPVRASSRWRWLTISEVPGNTYSVHRHTALVALLSLLPAFLLAPFTHVHVASRPGDHLAVVRSHFSSHAVPHNNRTSVVDDD